MKSRHFEIYEQEFVGTGLFGAPGGCYNEVATGWNIPARIWAIGKTFLSASIWMYSTAQQSRRSVCGGYGAS